MTERELAPGAVRWERLLWLYPVVFGGLAILGAARHYSPVPYWDMWDSYLNFFVSETGGDRAAWWAQHNEHRIVFSKLLFWIDLGWLRKGSTAFLIVCNFLLAAAAAWVLQRFLKALLPDKDDRALRLVVGALIWTLAFTWVQQENFTWAFQSQFFAAQLFPLTAFYLLGRSLAAPGGRNDLFIGACIVGIASAGTMANGVLALPIMTVTAIVTRAAGWRRVLVLLTLSIVVATAYFIDYQSPSGHGKVTEAVLNRPFDLIRFVVLYLGSPAYFFTGGSIEAAKVAGVLTLLASAFLFARILLVERPAALSTSLLAFVGYILLSAVAVAGGRLVLSMQAALAGRYTTSTLMLWGALLILFVGCFGQRLRRWVPQAAGVAVVAGLLMLPSQLRALDVDRAGQFEKMVAALALELGVHDAASIGRVYPWADLALQKAREPSNLDLSIFGHPAIRDAAQSLGQPAPGPVSSARAGACAGHLDVVRHLDEDRRFLKIVGWIYDRGSAGVPLSAAAADRNGRIIGHVITGRERPDVAKVVDAGAGRSGFDGYVLAEHLDSLAYLQGTDPGCRLALTIPPDAPRPR